MFEKEKKQYEEDIKNYERPWELWEYKIIGRDAYTDAYHHPHWLSGYHYRRKPEYYSGLNWRDAEHLVGKTVECTNHPDEVWKVGRLWEIVPTGKNFCVDCASFFTYIRTCKETFRHPTINIGSVELPMPETVAPVNGTKYWIFPYPSHSKLFRSAHWSGAPYFINILQAGQIHLTEERAKAWADWWKATVIDKME